MKVSGLGRRRLRSWHLPSYVPEVPSARLPVTRLPILGPELPRAGGLISRAAGRWTLRILGWSVRGEIPNVRKLVIIVAPHTSNWDFVVGLAAKLALGLRVTFLGKDSLFRFPLGPFMRAWGGIPIDRSESHDVVKDIVDEFARRDQLVLALAPEGTRKRVQRWRTGFYYVAHRAGVPIVTVALNFGERAIQIGTPFRTTGDAADDVLRLQRRFQEVRGRRSKT